MRLRKRGAVSRSLYFLEEVSLHLVLRGEGQTEE